MSFDAGQTIQRDGMFRSVLQELHDANGRFHVARLHLELAMSDTRFGHHERVATGHEELRAAERLLEKIDAKIQAIFDAAGEARSKSCSICGFEKCAKR